ncbi:pyridoxal phosphate-dependent transferase [Zopfochytrium polystomum]|nr:pyridoxal phosphate-dependent transferase [Zopfochytrium polystomum]
MRSILPLLLQSSRSRTVAASSSSSSFTAIATRSSRLLRTGPPASAPPSSSLQHPPRLTVHSPLLDSQSKRNMASSSGSTAAAPPHRLLMIPGPVEFDDQVLAAMATPALSHVDPYFIDKFGSALELLRKVFYAPTGQPFIVAGSGTLTWDATAANLVEPNDPVLVISTGVFGEWFGECIQVYGGDVTYLRAPAFGDRPSLEAIEAALRQKKYKLMTVTHVDTSSGVLNDVKAVAEVVRRVSPDTLIALDGVCSVAAEDIQQEAWGIDVVMTASQKALGVPPGLAVMVVSQRALDVALNRKAAPSTYFASFKKWLPIMKKYEARQPSYFATPPVQLILALQVSLTQFVQAQPSGTLSTRFAEHVAASEKVKDVLEGELKLKLVPVRREVAAHTLTAVYYPAGMAPGEFLGKVASKGVVLAGGLHPDHATTYFRVGHMNVSAVKDGELQHLEKTLKAIKEALAELGYNAHL